MLVLLPCYIMVGQSVYRVLFAALHSIPMESCADGQYACAPAVSIHIPLRQPMLFQRVLRHNAMDVMCLVATEHVRDAPSRRPYAMQCVNEAGLAL